MSRLQTLNGLLKTKHKICEYIGTARNHDIAVNEYVARENVTITQELGMKL